jgi:predicted GTPase
MVGRSRLKTYERALEDFRASSLTEEQEYPWQLDWGLAQNNVKAFRILVCGKTGVGKSTLINRVFGVHLVSLLTRFGSQDTCLLNQTEESEDLNQGVHDIDVPFESPMHPGLIIHDSRGYQAGSFEELRLIEKFVKKRSSKAEPTERLHAIWYRYLQYIRELRS